MDPILDNLAQMIARQMNQEEPLALEPDLLMSPDGKGRLVMSLLDNLLEHLDRGLPSTDDLVGAYLFLLTGQLQEVRYKVDRQYDWARQLVADFQGQLVEQAQAGRLPDLLLQQLILILHEVHIKPEPALLEVAEDHLTGGDRTEMEPPSPEQLLDLMEEQLGKGDEFQAAQMFTEMTIGGPGEGRAMLAGLLLDGPYERLREAVPLLVLDADPEFRRILLEGLGRTETGTRLSPTGLRRLIALRNWLPEQERELLDQAVRAARRRKLDCQPWPKGSRAEIMASPVDGSGAQGLLVVARSGKRFQLHSLLFRLTVGVLEAWSVPQARTRKQIDKTLDMAAMEVNMEPVSRAYLDLAIKHHLAVGAQRNEMPPVGLLAIAEALGAADWLPNPLDPRQAVESLLADRLPDEGLVEVLVKESDAWGFESGVIGTWFEDNQEVAELFASTRARRRDTLARQVLERIIEPRWELWAEKMVWAALWLRDVEGPDSEMTLYFLLVARALYQGVPLKSIGLMKLIANRTVETQRPF